MKMEEFSDDPNNPEWNWYQDMKSQAKEYDWDTLIAPMQITLQDKIIAEIETADPENIGGDAMKEECIKIIKKLFGFDNEDKQD